MRLVAVVAAILVLAGCTSGSTSKRPSTSPSAPPSTTTSHSSSALPAPGAAADWPMYHGDPAHSGVSTTMPTAGTPHVTQRLKLDGKVYASPIVVGGVTIVATENDTVYAFDQQRHQLWKTRLGDPSPAVERPCGNIDPLGITGTPIYSPQTGNVYAVAEHGGAVRHELIALNAHTGAVQWRRPVDLPGPDPVAMQQRGALAITGGRVWVPFGALFGDCSNYKGRVVGVRLDGTGDPIGYDPSTRRQGGMWNPAGATVDAAGQLLVVSANGSSFPGDAYDHTNSVLELSAAGTLLDSFAPSDWAENNEGDVGLGSQGVALVGTQWAVLGGKSGPVYVLRQGRLGGIGGQVDEQDICRSFGGAAVVGDVVYLPCTDGVRAVRIDGSGHLHVLWHAADSTTGSPVVGGGRVWSLDPDAGVLHSLDPATGRSLAEVDVGVTSRFATPAIYGSNLLVPTESGCTVVSVSAS
jgi:outer membrane protein assembly factor BamB